MATSRRSSHLRESERQRINKRNNIRSFEIEQIEEVIIHKGKIDPIILLSLIILVSFGVIMVFSASYYVGKTDFNDILHFFKRQGLFAIIGFILVAIIIHFDWRFYKNSSKMVFIVSIIFLVLVLFIGKEVKGAKRWIGIGPIQFQPSEVAKVGLILYLSKYVSDNKNILNTWEGFLKCCFIIAIPTGLVLIENTSTAIIMAVIGMSIIFVASPTIKYFVPMVLFGVLGIAGIIIFGDTFRMARVQAWLNPFAEGVINDKGYQTVQSLYAIASGGFFGLGIGQSRQKLGFIPEAQNDIIFSIICEELGLAGAIIFILLFAMIIWRGYIVAIHSPKSYMSYVCVGITTMIAVQVIINIAVVTNTMPNTGIPLPFVSYGGTSLLIMMACTGLILNFSRYFKD
ncbi:putative lipid II flippase FtsW [uncultured Tyzzerella sp.]|uniref:putative lipid II flippase FtsW n=1 Tax=uncultured Tyzzerella sp. TaxID=2321398 RepID=UPI00294368CE|nr:putative lipid II flippase FtsW [uncultured Tyzzerella sp.]